jgi:hypothetical protein
MSSSSNGRSKRHNPYITEEILVQFHHSAAGIAWRWRTELALVLATAAALWRLALLTGLFWAGIVLAAFAALMLALPWTRRFITRRFWCVLSRHRVQRVCYETRLHTRAGRIPLVLWIRPTKVGERAHLLLRAGACAKDFSDHGAEIAAACYAREARVTASTRWSHLITIDIARRDPLAAKETVPSHLAAMRAHHHPAATGGELADTRP